MRNFRYVAILFLITMLFSSCGLLVGGRHYQAHIEVMDHPAARIFVDGQDIGQGKAFETFSRKEPLMLEVKQEGCQTQFVSFGRAYRVGPFFFNFLLAGGLSHVIDLATGAAYRPDHEKDARVERISDKTFLFTIPYEGCPTKSRWD